MERLMVKGISPSAHKHVRVRGLQFIVMYICSRSAQSMSHRTFTDSVGRSWQVWNVTPNRPERRLSHEQALDVSDFDRRRREQYRVLLGDEWARGWLAFETTGEKRRLSAFPENWSELTESTLEDLCGRAVPVRPPRRINA